MKSIKRAFLAVIVILVFSAFALKETSKPDLEMVAKIREEGFQRSQVMDIVGYMTDVLGARLTLSKDMKRAQIWVKEKMEKIGLVNTVIEPFMDYGVTWDNIYFSLHMLKPDYQPMMGFPLTHTPSTNGRISCPVVVADINTKKDLDNFKGKLRGTAVLWTKPAVIDLTRLAQATPRRTPEELKKLEEAARILKAIGARPRRTIRVALWSGEEQGIHGSREYVLKHFGNPKDPKIGVKPEYEKFSVYFNQDYGAGAFRGIFLQGNEHARHIFEAWTEPLRNLGFTTISIQKVGSTDHVSFDAVGLSGFQFIQDRIPGTAGHTNLDFLDTLQAEDLLKNAVFMAVFAYHSAVINERIPRKTMVIPDRKNN